MGFIIQFVIHYKASILSPIHIQERSGNQSGLCHQTFFLARKLDLSTRLIEHCAIKYHEILYS